MEQISLRELRVSNGISATHIAKLLNISRQTLCNKESGKTQWSAIEVQALCALYRVPITDLKLQ